MLKLLIELHPAGGGPPELLHLGYIINTGTGTEDMGNYRWWLMEKGATKIADVQDRKNVWATGHVKGFARKNCNAWELLECVIAARLEDKFTKAIAAQVEKKGNNDEDHLPKNHLDGERHNP